MALFQRTSLFGLIVATGAVSIALLLTSQFEFLSTRTPFALFFAAVILSARFGTKPAFLAMILSVVATDFFIIPPLYTLRISSLNLIEEIVFVAVSMLIVYLTYARQRSEKSRRESEERYRIIAQTAADAIITIDEKSTILFINPAGTKIFGYALQEMLGNSLTMLMPEYLRQVHEAGVNRYVTTRRAHVNWNSIEVTGLHKEGHEVPLELSFGEFRENDQYRFTGIVRDITNRKKAQKERDRFFALGADVMVIAGFDSRFRWVNPASERTLGWSAEELTSRPWLDFVHEEDQEKTIAEAQKLFAGVETFEFENRYRHKDGSYRWLRWRVRPYENEQLLYGAATDITDHKLLEEQLRQSQKLESVGQLAGGVAHDFNNLLTVITGYGELSLQRLTEDNPLRRNVEGILKASERATALTRQLLAFSRKQVMQPKTLDLTSTIFDLDKMLQRLIGEHITLVTMLDPSLGKVMADPGQIEQVIMNLAVNSRDAMPDGGKLTIETKNVMLDEAYARHHVSVVPGPYVMLAVSDTGHGMEPGIVSHIFEPFFTTKEQGKGTGLGLSMVYGIVKQSGGNIWVYSEPGHGTTFKIYLPIVEAPADFNNKTEKVSEPAQANETILLVEDEPAVRMLLMAVLEDEGYTVLEAANGYEALDVCQKHTGKIDLLMTDVVMPGMSGRQLVERLSGDRKELKVLYMSGYTDNAIVHHGVLDPGVAFLQKPFTPDAVAQKIREVLKG